MTRQLRWGIIGGGLMGREFASAAARWCHLAEPAARPVVAAICDTSQAVRDWFTGRFDSIRLSTADYRELLASPEVDAVYAALPHHLHAEVYLAAIAAGKHLMGEKPFGIDLAANRAIVTAAAARSDLLVRCSSEFPFFPAVQEIGRMIDGGALGRIIELASGFLHSSDLDPQKPINWKRVVATSGLYGVMGDLGMHVCHVPLRAGWQPSSVRAVLANIVGQRPDGHGRMALCDTWDNATLLLTAREPANGEAFPWTLRTHRIAPGEQNTWYLEILGTKASVRFSTRNPNVFERLDSPGGRQVWGRIECGYQSAYRTITGGIFEFGFGDAILQMWAAFHHELVHGRPANRFAGCATPEETAASHRIFTAALESHATGQTIEL